MRRATVFAIVVCASAFAVAAPVPKEDDAARMVRIYGTRANPKDEARYEMRGDALRVFLPACEIPPRRDFERPTPQQQALWDWKRTPEDGSRVWRAVRGDFMAVVRVSFPLRGAVSINQTWRPRVAGLVIWSSVKDHFGMIRHEELTRPPANQAPVKQLSVHEAFQSILTHPAGVRMSGGELKGSSNSAFLRVKRSGKSVTAAYSRDGKEWTEFLADEVEWKDTVKVGVYAKHFSDTPFEATFDEYTLTVPKK
ncbi:MAG: DUF1349 domain-containing protein [Planctomycetia bacterium]|nr:DUF1349 domain-containing protein [Planctomycetia bacterium]